MKQLFLFIILAFTISSCHKYATAPVSTNILDTSKPYKLKSYINNGVDNTAKYAEYSFQFGADGQVIANKGGILNQGLWSITQDVMLIRNFATTPFDVWNQNWTIKQIGLGEINLSSTIGLDTKSLIFAQ